ncbi:patatin-like phospholipase family protein [Lacinutrix neustonica]|uniref:Patatin-like phospholipase family protein n=1 Tax=Lacinutrix neustonica TaxID=2980107 RepID=A0A9E8MX36_9FLAO|nr:patatin-like phospholipase family protein [Lacinutrix neustonica]WAC02515.1 patatin-like phospholipase family protein [Lacinutrix neustonica]
MKKIGLVLSGGGALGVAHPALIKTIEAHGYRPNLISGTSAGACIGALYNWDMAPKPCLIL